MIIEVGTQFRNAEFDGQTGMKTHPIRAEPCNCDQAQIDHADQASKNFAVSIKHLALRPAQRPSSVLQAQPNKQAPKPCEIP